MDVANLPKYRKGPTGRRIGHNFGCVCRKRGFKRKITKSYQPWTNAQAERTNSAVKEAAVRAYHHLYLDVFSAYVVTFLQGQNFAKDFKVLRW